MRLNVEAWKPFKINEIFEVKYGINMELNACTIADDDDDDVDVAVKIDFPGILDHHGEAFFFRELLVTVEEGFVFLLHFLSDLGFDLGERLHLFFCH